MNKQKELDCKLKNSLYFEKTLAKIALYFVENDNFEDRINFILEVVSKAIDASRGYIFEKVPDGGNITNTFHWYRNDISSRIEVYKNLNFKPEKSWEELLDKDGIICIEDMKNLPETLKTTIGIEGILSIIMYPIYRDSEIIGFVGFDYYEFHYKWTKNKYEFLKAILGIISRTYDERYRKNLAIEGMEKLENIIKASNYGKWEWNVNTGSISINERYANIMGYKLEELEKFTIYDLKNFVERSDLKKAEKIIDEYFRGEIDSYNSEIRIRHKDGKLVWITKRGKITKWNRDGSPRIIIGTIFDHTDCKENEIEKLKYLMAIEQATVTFVMTDLKGIVEYVNPAFEKSSGYSLDDVIGQYTSFFKNELNSKELKMEIIETTMNEDTWEGEITSRKKDGTIYYEEVRITPIIDKDGEVTSYLSIKQDITKRKILEEKLRESSTKDDLTNIYNRRFVFQRLEEISEQYKRKQEVFSIAILDIDKFKKINDTFGHPGGDFILQEFSKLLSKKIRISDVLGRYGGEEFIIIFIDSNKNDSKIIVDRIRESVEKTAFSYKEKEVKFTFSAGISDASESDIKNFSFEYLINEADKRLYRAKDKGRNKVVID